MVLEAFASYLGDLLAQAAHDELGMLLGVPGDIERMGKKLRYLKKFLADADRRNITDESVQEWVGDLKRAMYEAADILDLCRLKAMEWSDPSAAQVGCFNPFLLCLRNPLHAHDIGTRIKALNQRLDTIKEDSSMFSSTNLSSYEDRGSRVAPSTIREHETSWELDLSGLVGDKIEEDTKKLVEIMLTEKCDRINNFKVIAIVGVGGIGKTTLAQNVFNDEAIQNEFDTKIWLSVNKDFDKAELLRTAITHAEGDHHDGKSLAVLQPTLTATLEGKKVLIVMDDVWNQRAWEDVLKLPLVKAAPGSRVLITTRHESVAHKMSAMWPYHHIDTLTSEDAWSLLKKQAFSSDMNESDIDTLKEIGLQIVEKCGCLPLAVKVMGGLLHNKEKLHWERVLGDSLWSRSEIVEELNSAVHLSYEDLPPHLKQCFLYCSLLPKSRSFHVNMVVAMWIGEGFIHGNSNDLEKEGTDYYKELISRNLIEKNNWRARDNWYCSMHDIIRSFAQYVARDEALISHNRETDISNKLNSQKFLRLSIGAEGWQSGELEWRSIQDQNSVRTLISVGQINMKPDDSLVTFSSLRTLHIQSTNVAALLDSLHQLKHLRYLALQSTDISALPRNIGKMKLLQHINLTDCKSLVELPDSIVKLGDLRYLNLRDVIVDIPKGFRGLTNMRRLSGFRAHMDGDWCSLEELGPLSQLSLIGVEQLENVSTASSAAKANLGEKKHLIDMSLSCTSRLGSDGLVKEKEGVPEVERRHIENVFDELGPPPSVENVDIKGYFGQRLPKWIMSTTAASFNTLMFVRMFDLACCTKLPDGLCQLPCLQHLKICRAPCIKKVGPEFLGPSRGVAAFPKLNRMILDGMVEWEEWEWKEQVQAFPHLDNLLLRRCKLRLVPPGLASNARALKKLAVREVQNLSYLKDFASLVELEVANNFELKWITDLPKLEKLTIINCPRMKVLQGVPTLQRLVLRDEVMIKLPEYIQDVKARHLLLECRLWLLTSVAAGEPDPEWKKLSHIEHVKAYAHDGDNRRKWYVLYTRDRNKLESNISRPPEFEEALSSSMENDAQGFESVFKMRRTTFEYICRLVRVPCLEDMMARSHTFDNGKVLSLQDRVAVALRMLNSGDTLETVGSSIGVNGPTISLVTEMFVKAMNKRARHHLCWPDSGGMEKIKSKFDMLHGLPNCCGVVHTTHITLGLSEQNCDGKKNDNILLQALVDTDSRFTNIWVSSSSDSMNQSSLLHNSGLFNKCENGAWLNGSKLKVSADGSDVGEYIIGDAGYPLLPWLLTPYQVEDLSDSKVVFNRRHSKATAVMSRALERLKDTWKCLDRGKWLPRQLLSTIYACCSLHNIVIDKEKPCMPSYQVNYKQPVRRLADEDAVRARDMLSQHLTCSRPSESGGESGDENDDNDPDGNNEEARGGGSDSEQTDQEPDDKGEAGNEEAPVTQAVDVRLILADITKSCEAPSVDTSARVPVRATGMEEAAVTAPTTGTLSLLEYAHRFESVLKMTKRTFNYICSSVKYDMMMVCTFVDGRVLSSQDQVALALRALNSGETPETLGSSVGVNESTVSPVTWRFVVAMNNVLQPIHLRWPDSGEMERIKSKFNKIHGLPNCCGVLGTARLTFGSPEANIDNEECSSVLIQTVVDSDMRFTSIRSVWSDNMNQCSILRQSVLFNMCEKGERLNGSKLNVSSDGLEVGEYIIGDGGYPLLPWLLTPYKENDLLDLPARAEFNKKHYAAREIALKAMTRFKDTWKILHGDMWRPKSQHEVRRIIFTCCMLHNIVIDKEKSEGMEEARMPRFHGVNYKQQVRRLVDEDAVMARDILSQHLTCSRPSESEGKSGDHEYDDQDSDDNDVEARGGSDSKETDQELDIKGEAGNYSGAPATADEEAAAKQAVDIHLILADITKGGEAPSVGSSTGVPVRATVVEEAAAIAQTTAKSGIEDEDYGYDDNDEEAGGGRSDSEQMGQRFPLSRSDMEAAATVDARLILVDIRKSKEAPSVDTSAGVPVRAAGVDEAAGTAPTTGTLEYAQRFESVLKMKEETFNYVYGLVKYGRKMVWVSRWTFVDRRVLSSQDRVALALRALNSGETPEILASSVGVNESTVSPVTWMFVETMCTRSRPAHLRWPYSGEMERIKSKFNKIHGLPNCCGVLSTARLTFGSPEANVDNEECSSVLIQTVVDSDMRFTSIRSVWSDNMNQCSILRQSVLFNMCEKGERLNGSKLNVSSDGLEVGEYIIGDAGYPLLPWLLTPYKENDLLDLPGRAEFNKKHYAAREIALKAMTRFKDTWKILHGDMWRPKSQHEVCRIIFTCCMLHNIVIDKEKSEGMEEARMPRLDGANYSQHVRRLADEDAVMARDVLSQYLACRPLESRGDEDKEKDVVSPVSGDEKKKQEGRIRTGEENAR